MKQLDINNENIKNAVINIISDILNLNSENTSIHIPINDEGELIFDDVTVEPSYCGYIYDDCINVNINDIRDAEIDDIDDVTLQYVIDEINEAIDEYNEQFEVS